MLIIWKNFLFQWWGHFYKNIKVICWTKTIMKNRYFFSFIKDKKTAGGEMFNKLLAIQHCSLHLNWLIWTGLNIKLETHMKIKNSANHFYDWHWFDNIKLKSVSLIIYCIEDFRIFLFKYLLQTLILKLFPLEFIIYCRSNVRIQLGE